MSAKPPSYILDSFALLAYLKGEAGGERVRDLLGLAQQRQALVYLSLINLGELLYITERNAGLHPAREALAAIDALSIELLEANRPRVLAAARLKAQFPLSYADAFGVAAAQEFQATLITGDPEFSAVAHLITIEWLPSKPKLTGKGFS
jgi:predicted nucleic acid-binding protein